MRRCGPGLYHLRDGRRAEPFSRWFMPQPAADDGSDRWVVGFHCAGAWDEAGLTEAEQVRLICHYLLTRLPDGALREAATELGEIYEFFTRPALPSKPPAPVRSVPAVVGRTFVRPVFPVTEE